MEVCSWGVTNVLADGTVTLGDLLGVSTMTGGDATDLGQTSRNNVASQTGILGPGVTACTGAGCTAMVSLDGIARTGRMVTSAMVPTLNQSTTGNAATATALASTPSQASSGQYCTGVTAAGNCNSAQVQYSQLGGTVTTWNQNTTGYGQIRRAVRADGGHVAEQSAYQRGRSDFGRRHGGRDAGHAEPDQRTGIVWSCANNSGAGRC